MGGQARTSACWDTCSPRLPSSPHLCVVELHGVVGGEGNMQPLVQEFPQRVFGIFEEQTVVAKGRHGNGDLSQVVEILQHRTLQKNHQTQVTRAREGRVGRVRVEREEGRGKASSVEARGLSSVCASPQPSPSSPKPGHSIPPPFPPNSTFTSFLHHMPISPWVCPPDHCWKCSLLPPKWRHSSGQLHAPADSNLHTQLPSPGADLKWMPHLVVLLL